jgi:hypothetical protein
MTRGAVFGDRLAVGADVAAVMAAEAVGLPLALPCESSVLVAWATRLQLEVSIVVSSSFLSGCRYRLG